MLKPGYWLIDEQQSYTFGDLKLDWKMRTGILRLKYSKNDDYRIALLLVILLFPACLFSQTTKDFQFWQKADVELNLTKIYDIGIGVESRLTNNASDLSYYYLDFSNIFQLSKKVRFALDFLYVNKDIGDYISHRYQYNAAITFKEKIHKFVIYDRLLNEGQYVDPGKGTETNMSDQYLRDKLTLRYKVKKWVYPYLEDEIYYLLVAQSKHRPSGFNRNRFYAGTQFYLNSTNKIDLFYMNEQNFNAKKPTINNVCGIGYSHSFF
jgi:hypothetical protein